jgi:hypothetical protein
MLEMDARDANVVIARLRAQAAADAIRVSLHAHQEMVEENIEYGQVQAVLANPQMLENYPDHKRGPCCLVCGQTSSGRFVHVVCTTALEVAIIVTVYEPSPPKWLTPYVRGERE